jgi:hypothetical protein
VFIEQTGLTDAKLGVAMREVISNYDESWFEIDGRAALTGEPFH